jgi:hypothetical protein
LRRACISALAGFVEAGESAEAALYRDSLRVKPAPSVGFAATFLEEAGRIADKAELPYSTYRHAIVVGRFISSQNGANMRGFAVGRGQD